LLALFLGYIALLGPVRYFIVRLKKRPSWSWRITLSTIVLFSAFTYGIALYQKGTNIQSNSVSIIRLSTGSSSASVSTYLGIFVPNEGNFQVHIPGNRLVQLPEDDYSD